MEYLRLLKVMQYKCYKSYGMSDRKAKAKLQWALRCIMAHADFKIIRGY